MKKTALLAVFLFAVLSSQAQNLRILDPQNWRNGQGTIEETKITYEPQGLYMKMDWEITFSAKGLHIFSESDTVEVEYRFNLPEGALITDSWLWFGDTILKAKIIDRWSAREIYEEIVGRRRDPSILFKNGNQNYELRIFPMAAKESRKVKLTVLLPAEWNSNTVSALFPAENIMVSKYPADIKVMAKLSPEWTNPVVSGENIIPLDVVNDSANDTTHFTFYNANELTHNQKFMVGSPLKSGPYLSFYENGDEKFYQLAVLPLQEMNIGEKQKILFLFDYQKENSNLSQEQLLNNFTERITTFFNGKDSFNILYHDFKLQKAADSWIPGDSTSIANAIGNLGKDPFVSYSNLATLLASGIEMAAAENNVKIILISNTDKLDDIPSANQLISDLLKLANPAVPVFISDFQTKNHTWYRGGGVNYQGNEYFYRNLARMTGGDYCSAKEGNSFTECFNKIYQSAASENGMIDIHTTLESGFCYGRFRLNKDENVFSKMPYLEMGKYSGEFPFKIEVTGEYAGEIFSNSITIEKENTTASDSVISQIWIGNEILELEKSAHYSSYGIINEIIDKSLANRILSLYTAFLALEPGMLDELNETDKRGEPTTAAEEIRNESEDIKIYPNPFTDKVNIEVQLPENMNRNHVKLEIYDLFGKLIKTFDARQFETLSEIKIEWNATSENGNRVPDGTYLFVCTTPEGKISKKLIII
ncbi:MAG: VIT domain-containing protein [Prolixibacteraceae bacterium]